MKEFYYELLVVPSCVEELFADFLLEATGEGIEETSAGNRCAFVVYSNDEPSWLVEKLDAFARDVGRRLGRDVFYMHRITKKRNHDWVECYKRSVMPVRCGRFAVRASWHEQDPACMASYTEGGLVDILIDPALAFGSGHHESTALCLELLGMMDVCQKRVLDVGCGSGILSIAAAKKGAVVEACDTDLLAVSESMKNFERNGVTADKIWHGSMEGASGSYSLIVANLQAMVIMALYEQFCLFTTMGSLLLLSGILESAKEEVLEHFAGFFVQDVKEKNGWVALLLQRSLNPNDKV